MFKSFEMKKVDLFILNKDLEKVSNLLYDLKIVEFFNQKVEKFEKFEIFDSTYHTSNLLKLRSTINFLKNFFENDTKSINLENPIIEVLNIKKEIEKIEKEILHIEDEIKRQNILVSLKVTKNDLISNKVIVGFIPSKNSRLLKKFDKFNISYNKLKLNDRIYFSAKTKKIDFEYKDFYLPKKIEINSKVKLKERNEDLIKLKEDITDISNSYLKELQRDELKLSKELSIHNVKSNFLKTENIIVMSGFIPELELKVLKKNLEETLGNKFEFEISNAPEDSPVKLNNIGSAKNFEDILRMYSIPKYNEIDPTFLMFLMFPIFFGFILGDVIYGLISLIIFTILKFKFKNIKSFMSVLQYSALSSILFGFIYGEFMGFEFHGSFYGFFERSHHPETLLLFAILFGVIHINLGLIVGFLNDMKKSLKKAVFNKASWFILELGIGILSLGIYTQDDIAKLVGIIFSLLSVILIYMGHGFIGIIEIPSFFTNILSYARLMAVGLSSIAIAVLVNDYTLILFNNGFFGIFFAILLFTLGHVFNIALGNFESFLHTLRLHYVEFFTKFYTGEGREFKPFGKKIHSFEDE